MLKAYIDGSHNDEIEAGFVACEPAWDGFDDLWRAIPDKSPLDNGAAKALERIEADDTMDWSSDERSEWVRFIIGFFLRNLASVAFIKKHIANLFEVAVEALERNYDEVRGPNDPATFAEAYAQSSPAGAEIHATNMLAELIDNDLAGANHFRHALGRA